MVSQGVSLNEAASSNVRPQPQMAGFKSRLAFELGEEASIPKPCVTGIGVVEQLPFCLFIRIHEQLPFCLFINYFRVKLAYLFEFLFCITSF